MLVNTFSPMMVKDGCHFIGRAATFEEIKAMVTSPWPWARNDSGHSMWLCTDSAISHEVTASILSVALDAKVPFERKNITLGHGDVAHVIIPNFRASEAREFSHKEVEAAGFRCFLVRVFDPELPRFKVVAQADDVGGSLILLGETSSLEEAQSWVASWEDGDVAIIDRQSV